MTADELARYEQEYLSDSQTGETIMGAFQQRLQKMKLEGIEQGFEQGKIQGEAAILIRQASRRFGKLPEWALAKLQSASVEKLEAWSDRILDANSLEEMLVD